MVRILGIDPGSRITGYGVVETTPRGIKYLASGCIRVQSDNFPERLQQIFDGVSQIIELYRPEQMAIEQVLCIRTPIRP